MSELQNDDVVVDNDEYVEVNETENVEPESEQDEAAELAPDSEPQHEENSEDGKINQEAINKVINRKHYEAQEAKRKAEELERRLQQYESQQNQQAPVVKDYFEYENDAEYQQAVRAKAEYDLRQQMQQQQQHQLMQQQQAEQQKKMQESLNSYVESGKKAGLSVEEMQQTGALVESYGVNADLQNALLQDSDGPLIVKHLAANPQAAFELSQMSPYQAALYIERNLRPAASKLKPKSTAAPAPTKRVESGSVDPDLGKYKHIGGAKFE